MKLRKLCVVVKELIPDLQNLAKLVSLLPSSRVSRSMGECPWSEAVGFTLGFHPDDTFEARTDIAYECVRGPGHGPKAKIRAGSVVWIVLIVLLRTEICLSWAVCAGIFEIFWRCKRLRTSFKRLMPHTRYPVLPEHTCYKQIVFSSKLREMEIEVTQSDHFKLPL